MTPYMFLLAFLDLTEQNVQKNSYDHFEFIDNLRICSCLACVYRVIDARGKFGEHERCVRVARGDSRVQL